MRSPATVMWYNFRPPSHLLIRRYTSQSRRPMQSWNPKAKYLNVVLKTVRAVPPISQPFLDFLQSNSYAAGIGISQSCNGLFLCRADNHKFSSMDYYVYNPTTNEARLIPPPDLAQETRQEVTAMNIAFDPSNSPHYKVVSICRVHKPYFSYTQINIYSSETGFWSSSEADFPRSSDHVDFSNGVFLHGSIHWPSHTEETSYCFDLENEAFKIMAMPPVQDGQTRRTIRFFGECGGRLLMIDFHEPFTMKFDVFGLESGCSSWGVKYNVDFSRWQRTFASRFCVLSVICGDDDELLVVYLPGRDSAGKGLMTYGLREGVLRKVHPPVPGWDLKMLEQKGASVVHPLIRTRFAV